MDTLLQDFHYSVRKLLKAPGFTAVAVTTLGLGIGAVIAMFTVIHGVVLRPLPYPDPDRLIHIEHLVPGENPDWRWGLSEAGYFHFLEHNRSLADLAVYTTGRLSLAGDESTEAMHVEVGRVSGNVFPVLGGTPAIGRLLAADDNGASPDAIVVLGYDFWRSRFGEDPSVVGRTIQLEGRPAEVVGVTAPGFTLPDHDTQVWIPLAISPANQPVNSHRFQAVARIAPGVSLEEAAADLRSLTARLPEVLPEVYYPGFMERTGFDVEVEPLRAQVVDGLDGMLWVLLGGVAIVLLIACANVANLFLARMEGRRTEMAIRTAMGASGRDLVGGYLAESLLISVLAAGLALVLAHAGIQLLLQIAPTDIPRASGIRVGAASVIAAGGVTILVTVAFGALPLLGRRGGFAALRQNALSATATPSQNRLRQAFVVAQVALALVLLASAGLMVRTFENLRAVDTGVDPEGVLTVQASLPFSTYDSDAATSRFWRALTERVAGLPGVVAVGATQELPFTGAEGGANCALVFTDDAAAQQRNRGCWASPVRVTPGYFEAMGIPVTGRVPSWNDVESGVGEMIVSRSLAHTLWPDGEAVGNGLRGNNRQPPFYSIVGVAGDVRSEGLTRPPKEHAYFPMIPIEGAGLWMSPNSMTVIVRTALSEPASLTPAIREIIRQMDPAVPIGAVRTMDDVVAGSMARTTFAMLLLGIAAAVALLLGVTGLYGVVAYLVERRTSEIGIRMALGARAPQVAGLIIRQSLALVAVGVVIGLGAAVLVTGALRSLLFDVEPTDPQVLLAVSLVLVLVALAASYLPARRATRVDPMVALRAE